MWLGMGLMYGLTVVASLAEFCNLLAAMCFLNSSNVLENSVGKYHMHLIIFFSLFFFFFNTLGDRK